MAESGFGKKIEETSSIPLNMQGRQQPNLRSSSQKQTSTDTEAPRKAINILRAGTP